MPSNSPPTPPVGPHLKAFRRYTKGFVVGPGDHFPHTAVLSCPCHYHHLLRKTFIPSPTTSTPVFQPLRHGIHLIRTRLRDIWPPHLLQRYRWGLHWDRRLPSAYILPKHSRDWSKARPIVSYTQTVCAPLSQTVASAIYCLLQVVFPELTALSDVLPLLRRIWRILQHYDPTDDLVLYQQDIAGFFNFATHPRMISTVEFPITRYAALQGLDLRDDQERLQRIFRGRWRKTSRSYHPVHLCDLPALVSHLLDSSYFTVGLTVFRQCQGASMGSPLAPALRSAVALFREYCFLRSFPTSSWRYATGLVLRARYVDNVFFLGPTHMLHTDSFKAIAQPFFYGRPLVMEYVTDETLLGFVLSTSQRTITFRQPPHLTLIRSNRTAGSPDMALAGFFTRGILICRLTRPRELIFPQLIDLTQQYLDKDFTMT